MAEMTIQTNDETVDSFVLDRLSNYGQAAEGSVLPPPQKGESRVPFASGVRVVSATAQGDSTTFGLRWVNVANDPTLKVDHYNIYYSLGETGQPVGPFIAQNSPASVVVHTVSPSPVTFYIQTVLANGMTSPLFGSPTAASNSLTSQLSPDITASLMANSLLSGYTVQAPVSITYNALLTGTTNILTCNAGNAPKGGALLSLGVRSTAPVATLSTFVLRVTVDGGTPADFPLLDGVALRWGDSAALCTSLTGTGFNVGDRLGYMLTLGFTSTLTVDAVSVGPGGGPNSYGCSTLWAAKN